MSCMYSLGRRLSSGHSDVRIMYSESSRCMRKGTQASPLSIQITLSLGKRSGMPLSTQLVMWIMLKCTNDSECMPIKRLICANEGSLQVKPAWKPSGLPTSCSADQPLYRHAFAVVRALQHDPH